MLPSGSADSVAAASGRFVTFRSAVLGLLLGTGICLLTPYNDYAVGNTFLVGNYFPPVVAVGLLATVVLVNAPLLRFGPRWAYRPGELAVVLAVTLVACSIPSQGFLRFTLPYLVVPFHFGEIQPDYWRAFLALELPTWLFPVQDYESARTSGVVDFFYARLPAGQSVPWSAWVGPVLVWGVFFGGQMLVLLSLAVIVRHQWAVNERLAFPLARLEADLIRPPEAGRSLNKLVAARGFWVAAAAVFVLHALAVLHLLDGATFPRVVLGFDLRQVFVERPWSLTSGYMKQASIYFSVIAVTYFIPSRVAFSMWFFVVLRELVIVNTASYGMDLPGGAWSDQHLGAVVFFGGTILWLGRAHWKHVLLSALRPGHHPEPENPFISYRLASVMLLAGLGLMLAFLLVFQVSWWVAGLIVGLNLLTHLVTTRVVAETGFLFFRTQTDTTLLYAKAGAEALSGRDVFFIGSATGSGTLQTRESLMTFALHGLQTAVLTGVARRQGTALVGLLLGMLVIGSVAGTASSLWSYYHHDVPMATSDQQVLNPVGLLEKPGNDHVRPLARDADGNFGQQRHHPFAWVGLGGLVTGVLTLGSLRFGAWPLSPVGYLVSHTWYAHMTWFSLLLGWGAKLIVLKLGGSGLFMQAKPFFVGLLFGEALAVAFWLVVSLIAVEQGYAVPRITLLPT